MRSTKNLKFLFLFTVIVAIGIFCRQTCYAFESGTFLLSNGTSLIKCIIKENKASLTKDLLNGNEWSYVTWPCYDKKSEAIYFEAENKNYGSNRAVFTLTLNTSLNSKKVTKVIEGRFPAISLTGDLLCFYRYPNQLWLLNTKTMDSRILISNFANYQPAIWISDKHLLYSDIDNNLIKLDVLSGVAEPTGHKFLIPGALSPDRKIVLCGSYDGKSITFYHISTNDVTKIEESSIFSMGSSFVWSQDSKQFLCTRQTFSNLIKFNESRALYKYSINGKRVKLIDRFALLGGISLK